MNENLIRSFQSYAVTKLNAEEKSKIYEFYDGSSKRKLKKSDIGVIDSRFVTNSYQLIHYHVYSTENNLEENIEHIKGKLKLEVDKRIDATNRLNTMMNADYKYIFTDETD